MHAVGGDFGDLLAGAHLDRERLQLLLGRDLEPLGQRRQHRGRRLDQPDLDVLVGVEAAQAVARELARGMAQLGCELDPCGARADDREAQAAAPGGCGLGMAAHEAAEHLLMNALGLGRAVEEQAVLGDPRHAEIVDHAADRDHQRVVAEAPRRGDLGAAGILHRVEHDLLAAAVEAAHPAELEGVVMGAGMGEVVEPVGIGAQRAGRDLVQQRLPDVAQRAVDQRDPRAATAAETVAEPARQHQPAGAAADDHDVRRHGDLCLRERRGGVRRARCRAIERQGGGLPGQAADLLRHQFSPRRGRSRQARDHP